MIMTAEKKAVASWAVSLVVFATTSVVATAATNHVMKKMAQRRARKEAAVNLCLND